MEDYIKILIAVFVCFFIVWSAKYYFEYKHSIKKANEQSKKQPEEQSEEQSEELENVNFDEPKFIKSEWIGSKPGYVFYRSDEYGLGYHLDTYRKNEKGEWVLK